MCVSDLKSIMTDNDLVCVTTDMSVFQDAVYESFDADLSGSCDAQSLVYVAGYVSFKMISKVKCMQCLDNLRQDRIMHVDSDIIMFDDNEDYMRTLNRGGLRYSSMELVMLGYSMWCILNLLISKKYKSDFLKRFDHKAVLSSLSCESISFDDMFDTDPHSVCLCSQQVCLLCINVRQFLQIFYLITILRIIILLLYYYYIIIILRIIIYIIILYSISAQTVVSKSRKLKTRAHT